MQLTFVDRDGVSLMMQSNLSITEMIRLRHDGALFFNRGYPKGTVADMAGLNYDQLETLRSSQTWEDEANEFIRHMGLLDSNKVRKDLGVIVNGRAPRSHRVKEGDGRAWAGIVIGAVLGFALLLWWGHEDTKEYWRVNPTPEMKRARESALNAAYRKYRLFGDRYRSELQKQLLENNISATPEEYDSIYRELRGE